jgi:glycerol-3-phosphate dehydrogenase
MLDHFNNIQQLILAKVKVTSMKLENEEFDLVVIGGGVNGTGIAADAAGRGLKVLLCEKQDLASATSSNSSKLIHGGLRYLEHYEFRLVREALAEREVLLEKAPHIIWPMRFILPHRPHLRPGWMIRMGLFLYDNLAKRKSLKGSCGIKFSDKSPVNSNMKKGFEYSDAWVDDARLVTLNAVEAKNKGATILTRTQCVSAKRSDEAWEITLEGTTSKKITNIKSKALINAAGPWVKNFFDSALKKNSSKNIRLIKGSHFVVPKIHNDDEAYILQNEDKRIVFVIPYEDDFSLVGTTDVEYQGNPFEAKISEEEINYLVDIVNKHFKHKISPSDVVHSFSGVRPLLDDESSAPDAITRDYTFDLQDQDGKTPLLSIYGGKITTYRKLSESAVNEICKYFPEAKGAWTKTSSVPGGDFDTQESLLKTLSNAYFFLPSKVIKRYVRTYGTHTFQLLNGVFLLEDMGNDFGSGLYEKEVIYLIENEWAMDVDDILWRRTKMGLRLTDEQKILLTSFIKTKHTSLVG